MRLAAILLIPGLLCAQPRGPRPWWDSEVAHELNLTDAQMKQIRQTQNDFRPRMRELRDEVAQAESTVESAFNEDPVDQAKANEAINRLAAARAEVTKAVSQMDLKLRTILTAEQWQQLKQYRPRPGGRRGSRTPTTPSIPQK